jgi:GlpG protein
MREIGTIPEREAAERLADYLLTLGIATHLDHEAGGWILWVRDEDQLERAKNEMREFLQNPDDARYQNAKQAAQDVRRAEELRERVFRKNYVNMSRQWDRRSLRGTPLTLGVLVICVAVALLTWFGTANEEVLGKLLISEYALRGLDDQPLRIPVWKQVKAGEVWRLITPIFLHFGIPHVVFNMWCWFVLGSAFEIRRGTWRLALFVLITAVVSNVAQFEYSGTPLFGGMSGVVYGLFGYIWMKSRFDPGAGLYMDPRNTIIMIAWLFLCMTGAVGHIANAAHVAGLIVGVVIGYAPIAWRKLRP